VVRLETKRTKILSTKSFGSCLSASGTAGFGRTNERFIATAADRRRGILTADMLWIQAVESGDGDE
jgi:hypothetical protein